MATQSLPRFYDWPLVPIALAVVLLISSCGGGGGGSSTPPPPPPPPAPSIASLSATSVTAGSAGFTLTVNGSNFVSGSTVHWNGSPRTTTFVSSTQLTATIPTGDVATAGTVQVTVVNPGSATSAAVTFTVNNPVATASALTPSSAIAGDPPFLLRVQGAGFVSNSVVQWNGTGRPTTFASSIELSVSIPASDLTSPGDAQITVVNPSPGGGSSNSARFPVYPRIGRVQNLLETMDGLPPTDFSFIYSASSANGRYIAFASRANNFAPNTANGLSDVFVRDTCVEAPPGCTPRTSAVSLASNGGLGDGDDVLIVPAISADGRYVAFKSSSTNLVMNDTNGRPDVFLRDTCAGAPNCTPSTIRVSVANDGSQAVIPPSQFPVGSTHPSVSAEGRFVAFTSDATNLVPGVTSGVNVYLRDTCLEATACTPSTTLVSITNSGSMGGILPAVSGDGRFVAYLAGQVFVRDTCVGASACTPTTSMVSVATDGTPANMSGQVFRVGISGDGRFVTFNSDATNLVPGDTNGQRDVFVHDRDADGDGIFDEPGAVATFRVSVSAAGAEGNGLSFEPWITPDGRFVGFSSSASNLVPGDMNAAFDIFVRDTCAGVPGCSPDIKRSSVAANGAETGTNSFAVSVSGDGRFASYATMTVINPNFLGDGLFLSRTGFDPISSVPQITALSPQSVPAGGTEFLLEVLGSGFSPRSVARWNGSDRVTVFISARKLLVRVLSGDAAVSGTVQVTVVNPSPGGGVSNALTFTIN